MAKIISLGISNRKDSILELIFKGNSSNLEALLQNPNFSTPLWLIVWDPVVMNAIAASSTAMNAVVNSSTAMNAIAASSTAMNAIINSQTALNAVVNSSTAMNAIAASSTAMNAIAASSIAMNAIAASSIAMNAIINSQTALNAVKNNSTVWNIFINGKGLTTKEVPAMTSNTAPEGVVSASSIYDPTYNAFKAFDKDPSSYWYAAGRAPQWIQYQFTVPVFVHTVTLTGYDSTGYGYNPNSITIQVSNDGNNFSNIQTFNQEFTSTPTTLYIAYKGYYKYWRVLVNSTNSYYPIIRELNFKGFIQPA